MVGLVSMLCSHPRPPCQTVRHEYTTILACLVKTFPTRAEFRELVQLTDYNDPESDFFEHMKHIQVNRKQEADGPWG